MGYGMGLTRLAGVQGARDSQDRQFALDDRQRRIAREDKLTARQDKLFEREDKAFDAAEAQKEAKRFMYNFVTSDGQDISGFDDIYNKVPDGYSSTTSRNADGTYSVQVRNEKDGSVAEPIKLTRDQLAQVGNKLATDPEAWASARTASEAAYAKDQTKYAYDANLEAVKHQNNLDVERVKAGDKPEYTNVDTDGAGVAWGINRNNMRVRVPSEPGYMKKERPSTQISIQNETFDRGAALRDDYRQDKKSVSDVKSAVSRANAMLKIGTPVSDLALQKTISEIFDTGTKAQSEVAQWRNPGDLSQRALGLLNRFVTGEYTDSQRKDLEQILQELETKVVDPSMTAIDKHYYDIATDTEVGVNPVHVIGRKGVDRATKAKPSPEQAREMLRQRGLIE